MKVNRLFGLVLTLALAILTGCSSGGSGTPATVVSGMVSKGPIKGGSVKIFALRNGIPDRSAPLGQAATDDKGNYTADIGAYTGPVQIEAIGGSFTDEISAVTVSLKGPMRAVFSNAVSGSQTIAITPLTELAYKKALGAGSFTPASIDDANAKIASFFGLGGIISVVPDAGGAGNDQKKYAAVLGSFSQYLNNKKNLGESLDDALPRLLAQIGDEVKDTGGLSVGTINDINIAIQNYSDSGKNKTGIAVTPLPVPSSGLLRLSTGLSSSGTASIGAIDATVIFPAGVTVRADAGTGETAAGVVTVSGMAAFAGNSLMTAKFSPAAGGAPAQIRIGLISVTGFGVGEFATIKFDLDAGGVFPADASAFVVTVFSATGTTGSLISGITATTSSVAAELK